MWGGQNSKKKGELSEAHFSKIMHQKNCALLIEPAFLRRRSLGQIDVAIISCDQIIIYEVKSSRESFFTIKQRVRLRASASYLGQLFQRSVCLRLVTAHLSVAF